MLSVANADVVPLAQISRPVETPRAKASPRRLISFATRQYPPTRKAAPVEYRELGLLRCSRLWFGARDHRGSLVDLPGGCRVRVTTMWHRRTRLESRRPASVPHRDRLPQVTPVERWTPGKDTVRAHAASFGPGAPKRRAAHRQPFPRTAMPEIGRHVLATPTPQRASGSGRRGDTLAG